MKRHAWVAWAKRPWQVCACCGLVALKNERTRRAMAAACPGVED